MSFTSPLKRHNESHPLHDVYILVLHFPEQHHFIFLYPSHPSTITVISNPNPTSTCPTQPAPATQPAPPAKPSAPKSSPFSTAKTAATQYPFDPAHLYTNPQTYPVIFSVPEAHADNQPAAVVAELDRELKPLGGTRIKVFRVAVLDDAIQCSIESTGPRHLHAMVEFMVDLPEKMEINEEVKKYLFYGDQFPLHLWDVTVPSPGTCPLLLRLQFFGDNLAAVQEVEMPTAKDVLGIVEEGVESLW
ncbi:hypothetical protein BDV19DRAFT_385282 [Aspergillus venezuelensis]